MSHLTLVAPPSRSMLQPALAHDIRNATAVIALNLETLEGLAGSSGVRAASAAHKLLMRITGFCNDSLCESGKQFSSTKRASFDLVENIHQILDVIRPIAPQSLKIIIRPDYRHLVCGNPNDVFRIVFNLVHNAVTLARLSGEITLLDFHLERVKGLTLLRITDNGPGIPPRIRRQLFRTASGRTTGTTNGYGLLIARELAERNGATLQLAETKAGTQFVLALPSVAAVESGASRSLGQRSASC